MSEFGVWTLDAVDGVFLLMRMWNMVALFFDRPTLQRQYLLRVVISGVHVQNACAQPYQVLLPCNVDMDTHDGRHHAALRLIVDVAQLRRDYPQHVSDLDEYLWSIAYCSVEDVAKMAWWRRMLSPRFGVFLREVDSQAYQAYSIHATSHDGLIRRR